MKVKVEPLVDVTGAGSRGRGHVVEATLRKNIWERLGGRVGDPFGTVPQGTLPPPLVLPPSHHQRLLLRHVYHVRGFRALCLEGMVAELPPWRFVLRHQTVEASPIFPCGGPTPVYVSGGAPSVHTFGGGSSVAVLGRSKREGGNSVPR